MASPGKALYFLPSSTEQTPEDDTLCSHQWGGLLSLGQNPKQKSCCYQTQVSLALWGYISTQMRSVLLGLREQAKPKARSGGRTSWRATVGSRWSGQNRSLVGGKGEATATRWMKSDVNICKFNSPEEDTQSLAADALNLVWASGRKLGGWKHRRGEAGKGTPQTA